MPVAQDVQALAPLLEYEPTAVIDGSIVVYFRQPSAVEKHEQPRKQGRKGQNVRETKMSERSCDM